MVQGADGLPPSDGPTERVGIGPVTAVGLLVVAPLERFLDPLDDVPGHVVRLEQRWLRRGPLIGWRLPVLVVVVPLAADRVAVGHQIVRFSAHEPVEVLVAVASVPNPPVELRRGAEEAFVGDELDRSASVGNQ